MLIETMKAHKLLLKCSHTKIKWKILIGCWNETEPATVEFAVTLTQFHNYVCIFGPKNLKKLYFYFSAKNHQFFH